MFVGLPVLGILAYCTKPWLLIHDIDRHIHVVSRDRDVKVDLIPSVFHVGDSRAAVVQRMEKAGYDYEPLRDTEWFVKEIGSVDLVCSARYTASMTFDDSDQLTTAVAQVQSVCL
jgi:hypothetical protein